MTKSHFSHTKIKKVIKSIEENNKFHLLEIYFFNKILQKYDKSNAINVLGEELLETMREIFTDMIYHIKISKAVHIRFNNSIIEMLTGENIIKS